MYSDSTAAARVQKKLNYCDGAGDERRLTGSWSVLCETLVVRRVWIDESTNICALS